MMKRIHVFFLCLMSLSAYAQHTVVVNPDGTHTTVIENGVSAICAEPAIIIRDIPQQVEYITVYTQYRKPRSAMEKALICVLMSSAFKIRRPFLSRKNK